MQNLNFYLLKQKISPIPEAYGNVCVCIYIFKLSQSSKPRTMYKISTIPTQEDMLNIWQGVYLREIGSTELENNAKTSLMEIVMGQKKRKKKVVHIHG